MRDPSRQKEPWSAPESTNGPSILQGLTDWAGVLHFCDMFHLLPGTANKECLFSLWSVQWSLCCNHLSSRDAKFHLEAGMIGLLDNIHDLIDSHWSRREYSFEEWVWALREADTTWMGPHRTCLITFPWYLKSTCQQSQGTADFVIGSLFRKLFQKWSWWCGTQQVLFSREMAIKGLLASDHNPLLISCLYSPWPSVFLSLQPSFQSTCRWLTGPQSWLLYLCRNWKKRMRNSLISVWRSFLTHVALQGFCKQLGCRSNKSVS